MLIFISSADNYTDLVYPSVQHNGFMMFFFILFSIAGTFFLIAILIAEFEVPHPTDVASSV